MKKFIMLAAFAAVMVSGLYAKNAYDYYNEGYDNYLTHHYKDAIENFKKAIKEKPDFVKSYCKAGLAYVAINYVDHAIFMYKKSIHIKPDYVEAYYNMGVALELKYPDKPEKAAEFYGKAIDKAVIEEETGIRHVKDKFSYVRSSINLARIYRAQEKYDDAILLLRDAMLYEPDNAELYNGAGLTYLEAGLTDFAVKFFMKALEARQRYAEASTNLAVAYMKQGKLARAIEILEDTLEKDPGFAGAQYNYGKALVHNGFYEKAIAHFEKAIMIDPEFAEAYYGLGKAHLHLNEFKEAEVAFREAVKIDKDYELAEQAIIEVRSKREQFRAHIEFPKKQEEGEEGYMEAEEAEEEGAEEKEDKFVEDVEDLRLEEYKEEGEEGGEGEEEEEAW